MRVKDFAQRRLCGRGRGLAPPFEIVARPTLGKVRKAGVEQPAMADDQIVRLEPVICLFERRQQRVQFGRRTLLVLVAVPEQLSAELRDWKSGCSGNSGVVRVDLVGRGIIKKKKHDK